MPSSGKIGWSHSMFLALCLSFFVLLVSLKQDISLPFTFSATFPAASTPAASLLKPHSAVWWLGLVLATLLLFLPRFLPHRGSQNAELLVALASRNFADAQRLLCFGADPLHHSSVYQPLQDAFRKCDAPYIKFLLDAGYPLQQDAILGVEWRASDAPAAVRTLLAAGADPAGGANCEALFAACRAGASAEAVEALLDAGLDPNGSRATGIVALHEAARSCTGDASLIRLLLRRGGNPHARSGTGVTPLHLAHHSAAVLALIAAGADPNARSRNTCTPLHMATTEDATAALIHGGAAVDPQTNPQQLRPLHMASRLQALPVMLCLIGAGADPSSRSHAGTALHHAMSRFRSCYAAVVLLLSAGASPAEVNRRGLTPLAFLADRCLSLPTVNATRLKAVSRSIGALLCAGASLDEVAMCGEGKKEQFMALVALAGIFTPMPPDEVTLLARWKADAKEKL